MPSANVSQESDIHGGRIDEAPEHMVTLVSLGGVTAGVRRLQVTLGPSPASVGGSVFRFVYGHPGVRARLSLLERDPHAITITFVRSRAAIFAQQPCPR